MDYYCCQVSMHEQSCQQKQHTCPCYPKLQLVRLPPTENSARVVNHELEIPHEYRNT